jgi:Domain of unknown function (DUF1996)
VWGRADGDLYDPYGSSDPEPAPPAKLRSRIGASLIIVALLAATARGGWLIFAGPTPLPGPTPVPTPIPPTGRTEAPKDTSTLRTVSSGVLPSVAFVVRCRLSHEATDDPILLPGKPGASHLHSFFGNRTTDASSSFASLSGRQTSCDDPGDTASYWIPTPVGAKWTAIRAYYGAGQLNPGDIAPYPDGLALIGGNPPQPDGHDQHTDPRTTPADTSHRPSEDHSAGTKAVDPKASDDQAAMWSCGRAVDEPGWTVTVPQCANGKQLAARITFGQCVQAPKNSEPNPSQPSALMNAVSPLDGACPTTHPLGIPELRIRAELSGTPSALSSGALDSLHADFLNAWDSATLRTLVRVCIAGQRTVEEIKLCGLAGTGPRVTGFGSNRS